MTDWAIMHALHPDVPVITFGIVFLLIAFVILWRRSKTSEVETLVQANERFRNEVRNDLIACKAEVEQYKKKLQDLEIQEKKHLGEIEALKSKLVEVEKRIEDYETALNQCNYAECKRIALLIKKQ